MREYNNESTVWEDIENLKVVVNDYSIKDKSVAKILETLYSIYCE
jgi:hypothetical protein